MNQKSDSEIKSQELLVLFEASLDDVKNAKRQQWAIAYYGLLVQAAIVGFFKVLDSNGTTTSDAGLIFLLSVSFLLASLCSYYLWDTHKGQTTYRKRIKRIYQQLSDNTRELWGELPKNYGEWRYLFFPYTLCFIAIQYLSVGFVAWLIYLA